MRVLVVGSGGREHALAWRLARDSDVSSVICAPGNPGMAALGPCAPVDLARPADLLALAAREAVDLTVVGPEAVLATGVASVFRDAGRPLLGPTREGATLETSKAYAKRFMAQARIPTAAFEVCDTLASALEAVAGRRFGFPVVIKADGLAAGKGVTLAGTREEAEAAVRAAMVDRRFGEAGGTLVIEECLTGPEVSLFALCDGDRAVPLGTAQDHKRIWDDDKGPNTGGMGAFAPSPLLGPRDVEDAMDRIVRPVLGTLREAGHPYRGFLYVSLMLTADGPKVIEFNVRFGDPEAQVVMPLLEGHVAQTFLAAAEGNLRTAALSLARERCVGVVLASEGYPDQVHAGQPIRGLEAASAVPEVVVFHAGTREVEGTLVASGGRVLTVVARGATFASAMDRAYQAVGQIHFEGMQYRHDIGRKALEPTGAGAAEERANG